MPFLERTIPVHVPGLRARDYAPYLASFFARTDHDELSLGEVWRSFFASGVQLPTPTGRHALWWFLEIEQFKPGDEVLVAAYNFYVIVQMLVQKGLVPVFVDIDVDTLCMSTADLRRKIGPRSRLVLVTHMFGIPADVKQIREICEQHGLRLFEDCAHAVGTRHEGVQVGQAGDGALFSFGIKKLVTTFGGGMLNLPKHGTAQPIPTPQTGPLTSFFDTGARAFTVCITDLRVGGSIESLVLRMARFMGARGRPWLLNVVSPDRNNPAYRFVADGRAPFKPFMKRMMVLQLLRIQEQIAKRRAIVDSIKDALSGIEEVRLLQEDKHGYFNGAYFGVYVPDPGQLSEYLRARRIGSNPREFFDCSQLEQFAAFRCECFGARQADRNLLRLPSYASMRHSEGKRVVDAIRDFFT